MIVVSQELTLKNDSVVDISISHDGNYAIAFCVVQ